MVPVGSKNLSRLSHTLGGSWTSRARILFDDPSRSAGSKTEAQRKGYAVKSAKVEGARKERVPTISKSDGLFPKLEYCLEGEAADYFQS